MLKTIIRKFVDQFLFLIELGQHLLSHDALAWDSVRKKGDAGFQRPTRYDDKVSAYAARLSRAGVLSVAHFGVQAELRWRAGCSLVPRADGDGREQARGAARPWPASRRAAATPGAAHLARDAEAAPAGVCGDARRVELGFGMDWLKKKWFLWEESLLPAALTSPRPPQRGDMVRNAQHSP